SGRSRIISAASSLHRRARARDAASSPVCTPGVLIEVTATAMWASSRNERMLARDQGAGAPPPAGWLASLVAWKKKSGRMWWWVSTVKVTAISLPNPGDSLRLGHECGAEIIEHA